nr:hypothetical protein [Tanacetum cinerariifolium]
GGPWRETVVGGRRGLPLRPVAIAGHLTGFARQLRSDGCHSRAALCRARAETGCEHARRVPEVAAPERGTSPDADGAAGCFAGGLRRRV